MSEHFRSPGRGGASVVMDPRDRVEGGPPEGELAVGAEEAEYVETGWRAFLRSWKFAAVLAAGCVLGLISIVAARPFGSSASERVSAWVGHPASCEKVGAASIGGRQPTVWKCEIQADTGSYTRCYTITRGAVNQFTGSRELGC